MEQARIPGATAHGHDYTMLLRWSEDEPMAVYFGFVHTGSENEGVSFWLVGRNLLCQALLEGRPAGGPEGDIQIVPNQMGTVQFVLRNKAINKTAALMVPAKPLRHFLLKTLAKVSILDEHIAAKADLERWLTQVLEDK